MTALIIGIKYIRNSEEYIKILTCDDIEQTIEFRSTVKWRER